MVCPSPRSRPLIPPPGQLPERKHALKTNPTIRKAQAMKTISIIKVQKIALTKTVAACYGSCPIVRV
jgi:hypothetical protein